MKRIIWPCAAALLVGLSALTYQSLWIDEANTAIRAMQPDLRSWWGFMKEQGGSDALMPLYMFYVWVWEKCFGNAEWTLRAANLPWLVISVACLAWCGKVEPKFRLAPWVFVLQPFVFYYIGEARPYAMQMAGICLMFPYLLEVGTLQKCGLLARIMFCVGMIVVPGASILGAPFAGLLWLQALLIVCISGGEFKAPSAKLTLASAAGLYSFAVFAGFVLGQDGARASGSAETSVLTLGFSVYELAGFLGLGPGRNSLRLADVSSFIPYWGWFAPAIGGIVLMAGQVMKERAAGAFPSRAVVFLLTGFVASVVVVATGYYGGFRVLGRHFAPLLPILVLIWAALFLFCWKNGRLVPRAAIIMILTMWIISCIQLRISDEHRRDDYRAAAAFAREQLGLGRLGWWAGDRAAASYYQVPDEWVRFHPIRPGFDGSEADRPAWIVLSKPDIYDQSGEIQKYIIVGDYVCVHEVESFKLYVAPSQ